MIYQFGAKRLTTGLEPREWTLSHLEIAGLIQDTVSKENCQEREINCKSANAECGESE
jgi:hypothetical protein